MVQPEESSIAKIDGTSSDRFIPQRLDNHNQTLFTITSINNHENEVLKMKLNLNSKKEVVSSLQETFPTENLDDFSSDLSQHLSTTSTGVRGTSDFQSQQYSNIFGFQNSFDQVIT